MVSSSVAYGGTKYDVFLSFRGPDSRDNFTSHLYAALRRNKIHTFMDDHLQRGDQISESLLRAIQHSKISVIIFSENYASSKWCLDELLKILECKEATGQIVIPVFYYVDPRDVRNQTGNFGSAFGKLLRNFRKQEKVWRNALKEIGSLSGWVSSNIRPEAMLVERIVGDVLKKLNTGWQSSSDHSGLVGIDSRIERIISLLSINIQEFAMVGIWGMGGIGKTTLAEAVFSEISCYFESSYFLGSVRDVERRGDLIRVRDDLISNLLEDNLRIGTPSIRHSHVKDRLSRKRVLVVLDDVNDTSQLEALLGSPNIFGPGSRIIVTTRDKQVLNSYSITNVYDVEKLQDDEALLLFTNHAFGQSHSDKPYVELSKRVVDYAQGVPLALKVVGSALCGKSILHWESALNKLKKVPNVRILDVLKISFDSLDSEEKDIFLDIACFFKGEKIDFVTKILDGCYNSVYSGINVLTDKSLIAITRFMELQMHDLLQEMAFDIVQKESEEPGKRSRLWRPEDVHHVLTKNSIKGIFLDMSKVNEMNLDPEVFANMYNLKFLKLYNESVTWSSKVHFPRGLKSLPDELRYLYWPGCPWESLPSGFCPENIVELNMAFSSVKQLWNGTQNLVSLRSLNLRHSKNLMEIPDLSRSTNLERLDLGHCDSLVEIPSSIQYLSKLTHFDLGNCKQLRKLPNGINLISLIYLNLFSCTKITNFPEISSNVKYIHLDMTAIDKVPESVAFITGLVKLKMSNCTKLTTLPNTIAKLNSLEELNLSGCENILEFPEISNDLPSIGCLASLRELNMRNCTKLERLPNSIWKLKSIKDVNLNGTAIKELPLTIPEVCNLQGLSFTGSEDRDPVPLRLPALSGFCYLRWLTLKDSHMIQVPEDISCLYSLTILDFSGNDFETIPASIKQLAKLQELNLSYCKRLLSLPELPSGLSCLNANDCISLETISSGQKFLSITGEGDYCFSNCFRLNHDSIKQIIDNVESSVDHLMKHKGDLAGVSRQFITCVPGSEVSNWFNYQSQTSSITIQLAPNWFSKDFRGFCFCLVLPFKDYPTCFRDDIKCIYRLESKHGDHFELNCHIRPWPTHGRKSTVIGSDHVFFFYQESLCFNILEECFRGNSFYDRPPTWYQLHEWFQPQGSFKFIFADENVKVRSCGVRPLYAPLSSYNKPTVHSWSVGYAEKDDFGERREAELHTEDGTQSDQKKKKEAETNQQEKRNANRKFLDYFSVCFRCN